MSDDLVSRYNYDEFVPEKFEPWMQFAESPPLGKRGPDFPLWRLADGGEITLHAICQAAQYTIVEFGSFT
jgi:hypothetical protein